MKTIFSLFLLVVLAGAGYIWWQNSQTVKSPEPDQQIQQEVSVELISRDEQEFNDSGQAKAIEDESDLWPFYNNPAVGISFNHPPDIILLEDGVVMDDAEQIYLEVEIKNIGEQVEPIDFDYDEAMENIQDLSGGEFGLAHGFPFENSQQVKSVGFLFAQDYMVLARFEVCDVALERKLRFYFNNKQITLTLFGPEDTLTKTMSKYFTVDPDNCGDYKMWDFDKQADFYQELLDGTASPEVQKWFDSFDDIAEKIIFAHR